MFFDIFFLSSICITGSTKDVSSVVGAPWRCGVLTTWGGTAGIRLGRLHGGGHDSTPQSGVEAPRLLKRSLPRLYYCCCGCCGCCVCWCICFVLLLFFCCSFVVVVVVTTLRKRVYVHNSWDLTTHNRSPTSESELPASAPPPSLRALTPVSARGLQINDSRKISNVEKAEKYREHEENNAQISMCKSWATEASTVHFSADCWQSREHSPRCVNTSKPVWNMPLPWSTTCAATSERRAGRESSTGDEATPSCRKSWNSSKSHPGWCITCVHHRTKHCAIPTKAPVVAQPRAQAEPLQNCTCEISTVCCTVCTVRAKICMQLECRPFCRGTEPKARRTWRTAGTAAAWSQRRDQPEHPVLVSRRVMCSVPWGSSTACCCCCCFGVCIQACVCPQRERMQRQSLRLIYMGQCLCTDPYPRPKNRRGRLPPPPLLRRRFTARRQQAWQQYQELHQNVECALWRPVCASQQESPTLWRRTEAEAHPERTLRTAGTCRWRALQGTPPLALVPRTRQEQARCTPQKALVPRTRLERARCTSPLVLAQRTWLERARRTRPLTQAPHTRQERARRTHPLALAPRTRQERARRTHPLALAPRTRQGLGRRAHPLALAPRKLLALARRNSLLAKPLVLERCTPPLALVEASGFACSNDRPIRTWLHFSICAKKDLEPKWPRSVEWFLYSKGIIIVRWADLSDFFSFIFVGKMCVFVSRPMKIVIFLRKNDYSPKRVVDFPPERNTFRNRQRFWRKKLQQQRWTLEIVKDFACESNFFHFSFFFSSFFFIFFRFFSIFHFSSFFPFSHFFFIFFIFFIFSFFYFFSFFHFFLKKKILSFFSFFYFFHFSFFFFSNFHYSSFSFNFFHFLSFSFIFFHFLSFSFIFLHFLPFSSIFLHFPSFSFIFLHFLSFSFIFLHFPSCSFMFLHVPSCSFMFFHVLSCSFMFFHVLSCSFMFFHVLSCSFMFFHVLSFSFVFFHFLSFSFIFFHVLSFSFVFFHFLSFSFIFLHFLSFSFIHFHFPSIFFHFYFLFFIFFHFLIIFFHFLSFSFIFLHFRLFSFISFHFLSFSFIFFHFLSFSFISFHFLCLCWVLKIWFFSGLNFVTISLDSSYVTNQFLGPSRGPLFLFSTFFFSRFLSFFLLLIFSFFSFFVHFFIFLIFHVFHRLFLFPKKKVSSFLCSCISFNYFLLLALVSEFNCFLRSRCSMEMWCPDDIGRDSWDWVGPPAWGRACFNSPEWGGGSSPVKTEPPQIVLLLLWLFRSVHSAHVCPRRERMQVTETYLHGSVPVHWPLPPD